MNEQMWSKFFELAAQRKGLYPVARFLMELSSCPIVISDSTLQILAAATPPGITYHFTAYLPADMLDNLDSYGQFSYGSTSIDEEQVPFRMATVGDGVVCGYIFQFGVMDQTVAGQEEMRAASLAALIELSRIKLEQDTERRYRNEFIQDILYNNIPSREAVQNRGHLWGWDLSKPHMIVAVEGDMQRSSAGKPERFDQWRQLVRDYLTGNEPSVIFADRSDQLILLIPQEGSQPGPNKVRVGALVKKLRQSISKRLPGFSFSAAAGRFYRSVSDLHRAYQEAKVALEINRLLNKQEQLVFFDELGALRLIYNQGEQELIEYYEETLGPLERHDRHYNTSLVETLAAYLQASGDPGKAAEYLFIHVNTLRYRIKKIEELLSQDLRKLDVLSNLFVAFQVKTILHSLIGDSFDQH